MQTESLHWKESAVPGDVALKGILATIKAARRGRAGRKGSVAIMTAAGMSALIPCAAIALDLANLYYTMSLDQRIADQSAIAGAYAYQQAGSSLTKAQSAAASLAVVNGAGSATVATSLVDSPSGDGNKAILVKVTSPVSLSGFGRYATESTATPSGATFKASGSAYAEIHSSTPCILALQNGGISGSGAINVAATGCSLASNGNVTATGGAKIVAQAVTAVGSITANNGGSITTSPTGGQVYPSASQSPDPFANAGVFTRLNTVVTALTTPTLPSMGSLPSGNTSLTCNSSSPTLTVAAGNYASITANSGCTKISFSGGTQTSISTGLYVNAGTTINFAAGTYQINQIDIAGSGATTINANGTVTFDVFNNFDLNGSASVTVNGPATYNFAAGNTSGAILDYSSGAMTFTNANGSGTSTFNMNGGMSFSQGGGATFPQGTYTIVSSNQGINVGNVTTVTFANGSYSISGLTGGILLASSAHLNIGSAMNADSVFQIPSVGNNDYAINTGGGSSISIGSFPYLDINGPVTISSSMTLGGGVISVNGQFTTCQSGGGTFSATGVSIISNAAVCFAQGFTAVNFSAPSTITGSTVGTAPTVALASESTSASTITAGVAAVMTGAAYFPNSTLTFSGSASFGGGGGCLQIVGGALTWAGSASTATTCSSMTAGSGAVSLVQ